MEPNPRYRREKELNCVFLQVVKNILDLKDEQLAVQMDAQDTLWGETGTLFLLSDKFSFLTYFCLWVPWSHDKCGFKPHASGATDK